MKNEEFGVPEVAAEFSVSEWTVYGWVRKGILKPVSPGGQIRFSRAAIEAFKPNTPRRGRKPKKLSTAPPKTNVPVPEKDSRVTPSWMKPRDSHFEQEEEL